MYIKTKIQKEEYPPIGSGNARELRELLGNIYDNQLFLNKEDLKVLKYLGQKGDHDKSPKIDN